jgi:hypothetical protein
MSTNARNAALVLGALTVLASVELGARVATGIDPGVYGVIVPALAVLTVGVWAGVRLAA